MTLLSKIAIFGLMTIAAVSVAAVVLPALPQAAELFAIPASAAPFVGQ